MHTHWSTSCVTHREQFSYWRDAISNAFVPLEPIPFKGDHAPASFQGSIQGTHLSALRLSTLSADGHEVSLTRSGIARQKGAPFFVNLLRRGSVHVTQYGERATAQAGDIYVVDSAAPWSVTFNEPYDMFCIEINEDVLRPRLGTMGRLPSPVLAGTGSQILRNYLGMLEKQCADELNELQDLILEHCVALVARSAAGAGSP